MNENRFSRLFNRQYETATPSDHVSLRGFTVNPLAASITPMQALMYQAAFEQAQKDSREPEWPEAEWWN